MYLPSSLHVHSFLTIISSPHIAYKFCLQCFLQMPYLGADHISLVSMSLYPGQCLACSGCSVTQDTDSRDIKNAGSWVRWLGLEIQLYCCVAV